MHSKATTHVHRPGPLKQSNKPHKGGRGKSKNNAKGRVSAKAHNSSKSSDLKRKERRHKANQIRKNKRDVILQKKRGLTSVHSPPHLVAIIPLSSCINTSDFLDKIKSCDEGISASYNEHGHCHINFMRQKQRYSFFVPEYDNLHSVMDSAKVADTILFLHASEKFDEYIELLLSTILAHSCPSTVHVVPGLENLNSKKKAEVKKEVTKNIESRFPNEKLMHADTKQEFQLLLRQIANQKQKSVAFRDTRSHIVAEKVQFIPGSDSESTGTLLISGYIRSQPLNVNGLLHIPGWGNFQMSKIVHEKDAYPLHERKQKHQNSVSQMEDISDDTLVTENADPKKQESLISEVVPDPMDCEQTWPTEEELRQASSDSEVSREIRKVVEGTSEYQSAWILESDDEEDEEDDDSDESDDSMITAVESLTTVNEDDDNDMASVSSGHQDDQDDELKDEDSKKYDETVNMEEEGKMLVRFREERLEQMFPDEMDTPIDEAARVRYQKFRGLKNFAEAPWDPMENLPPEYAKIYRFEKFKQTRKKVLSAEREGTAQGLYVTVHVKSVPQALYDDVANNRLLIAFGLLPHEQKMSVINVAIRKHPQCKVPIKSKDVLIFHIGFQRFVCQPIFSVHSTGNKFKYHRFLPSNTAVVASFFAPITFQPASVVVFQQQTDGTHELVATGSLLSVDPNRVVVKRVVLSGHPYRIMPKTAVIRYMFFNKDDVNWFKPIELRTKCGRKGHIKEALGSHGHMKCRFDRQLQSQDVVLMSLYKRVYPKWTYDVNVPTPVSPFDQTENLI